MILLKFLLLNLLAATCCLNVLNIELFGSNNSPDEMKHFADLIKSHNPDVVIAQRGSSAYCSIRVSGRKMVGIYTLANLVQILNMTEFVSTGINAKIQLTESGLVVSIWSLHLAWTQYTKEHAYFNNKTLQSENVYESEKKRISEIVELLKHPQFIQQIKNSDRIPVIVAGDFNVPSHLDWTEGTKKLHNGHVVDWPVIKLLSGAAGMTDSYREVHPNVSAHSGWTEHEYNSDNSTTYVIRDQFIFYRGSLRYLFLKTFVIFKITPYKHENKPSFFIGEEFLRRTPITYDGCKANVLLSGAAPSPDPNEDWDINNGSITFSPEYGFESSTFEYENSTDFDETDYEVDEDYSWVKRDVEHANLSEAENVEEKKRKKAEKRLEAHAASRTKNGINAE